jgi:hypothetical protein
MTNEWKPNKELIDWAKEHFSQMSIGGVWMPEGSGLTYVKIDEKKWRLKSMLDTEDAKQNHDRMKMLMWDIGIVIVDDEPSILPVPETAEEAYMQEVHQKREIAQSWADKDGTLLVDMGLEEVYPEYIEDKEILLENGDTHNVEIWAYKPTNPNTGEQLSIDPDDYHLLMGDEYFMRFKTKMYTYRALSRQEMVEHIDERKGQGVSSTGVGSKHIEGGEEGEVKIPPWLWGTYCAFNDITEGEEE